MLTFRGDAETANFRKKLIQQITLGNLDFLYFHDDRQAYGRRAVLIILLLEALEIFSLSFLFVTANTTTASGVIR